MAPKPTVIPRCEAFHRALSAAGYRDGDRVSRKALEAFLARVFGAAGRNVAAAYARTGASLGLWDCVDATRDKRAPLIYRTTRFKGASASGESPRG